MTFTDDLSLQFKHRLPKPLVVPAYGRLPDGAEDWGWRQAQ